MTDQEKFMALRQRLFKMIEKALIDSGGHCKNYEGELDVEFCYPNYFEDDKPPLVCITLHCYLLGWTRHYKFEGETFAEALNNFEETLDKFEEMLGELESEE